MESLSVSGSASASASAFTKRAYVTYLSNDRDYRGAIVLAYNLRKVNSVYSLYAIVTEQVTQPVRDAMETFGVKLLSYSLPEEFGKYIADKSYVNALIQKHYYGKYLVFSLTQFERVMYLDTDMLLLSNIDFILNDYDPTDTRVSMAFDMQTNYTRNIYIIQNGFNSGAIVFNPSSTLYETVMNGLAHAGYEGFLNWSTDQNLLNELIADKKIPFTPLSMAFNCSPVMYQTFINKQIISKVYIIHFMLHPKPWDFLDLKQSPNQLFSNYNALFFHEWCKLYHEMMTDAYFKRSFQPKSDPEVFWGLFQVGLSGGMMVSQTPVEKL